MICVTGAGGKVGGALVQLLAGSGAPLRLAFNSPGKAAVCQIKERASVLQSKTQKPVRFEISEGTRASVEKLTQDELMAGSEYLWLGRFHERLHISTRQYARLVRDWVTSIGLEASAYGTH